MVEVFVSIVSFIALMAILIGVHELGHLYVARANGVFCESISLGMGKVIWERTDKKNTKWRLSILPIGGYVKMFGDADASSVREKIPEGYSEADMNAMSAFRKKPWQRILIALGGPVANFLLAIFVFFALNVFRGIPEPQNIVKVISKDCVAFQSGIRTGDKIVSINGINTDTFADIAKALKKEKNSLNISINRKEEKINIKTKNPGKLGIMPDKVEYKKTGVLNGFCSALKTTYRVGAQNMLGIVKIFKFDNMDNVGGPLSMFKMTKEQKGLCDFFAMLALFSVMLGAINLLPIPILDGGAVLLSSIEWITGRRLKEKTVEVISIVGLVIVGGLMLLGIWNDTKQFSSTKKLIVLGLIATYYGIKYLRDKIKKK